MGARACEKEREDTMKTCNAIAILGLTALVPACSSMPDTGRMNAPFEVLPQSKQQQLQNQRAAMDKAAAARLLDLGRDGGGAANSEGY
tara:strand:- start:1371 stop:1634 length:264 start_codon:yes stop_codon:yes gene_type:complete